jgi:hypothetical protein
VTVKGSVKQLDRGTTVGIAGIVLALGATVGLMMAPPQSPPAYQTPVGLQSEIAKLVADQSAPSVRAAAAVPVATTARSGAMSSTAPETTTTSSTRGTRTGRRATANRASSTAAPTSTASARTTQVNPSAT